MIGVLDIIPFWHVTGLRSLTAGPLALPIAKAFIGRCPMLRNVALFRADQAKPQGGDIFERGATPLETDRQSLNDIAC